jgi:hypothetical protein
MATISHGRASVTVIRHSAGVSHEEAHWLSLGRGQVVAGLFHHG